MIENVKEQQQKKIIICHFKLRCISILIIYMRSAARYAKHFTFDNSANSHDITEVQN
jgi:uncharacterized membrane protein